MRNRELGNEQVRGADGGDGVNLSEQHPSNFAIKLKV